MAVKIKKMCYILTLWSGSLAMGYGVEDASLKQFLMSSLYSFDSIFSGIVWIDKLNDCVKNNLFQC